MLLIPNRASSSLGEAKCLRSVSLGPQSWGMWATWRAGTRHHLGWQAAPQRHSLPHDTSARSPARGPHSRAQATPGGHLGKVREAARSQEAFPPPEDSLGPGSTELLTSRFVFMEEGGLKCERVGEVSHLILNKRSVISYSGSWGRQGLTENLFSLRPVTPSHGRKKNYSPPRNRGNKRLRRDRAPTYKLLPSSERQRGKPCTRRQPESLQRRAGRNSDCSPRWCPIISRVPLPCQRALLFSIPFPGIWWHRSVLFLRAAGMLGLTNLKAKDHIW